MNCQTNSSSSFDRCKKKREGAAQFFKDDLRLVKNGHTLSKGERQKRRVDLHAKYDRASFSVGTESK